MALQEMVDQLTLAQITPAPTVAERITEGIRWAFQYDQPGWWDAMAMFGLLPEDEPCAVQHSPLNPGRTA